VSRHRRAGQPLSAGGDLLDPGFTPLSLLKMMRRFPRIDPLELDKMQARALDPIALKARWIAVSDEAEASMTELADTVRSGRGAQAVGRQCHRVRTSLHSSVFSLLLSQESSPVEDRDNG
jgi:hypothetical protein